MKKLFFLIVISILIINSSCTEEVITPIEIVKTDTVTNTIIETVLKTFDFKELTGYWEFNSVEYNNKVYTDCRDEEYLDETGDGVSAAYTGVNFDIDYENSMINYSQCDGVEFNGGEFIDVSFNEELLRFYNIRNDSYFCCNYRLSF